MKKFTIIIFSLLLSVNAIAGDGETYFGIQTGVMYPKIFNITLSAEKETLYHNAYEFYVDYATEVKRCDECGKYCSKSFWGENLSYAFGLAYKPVLKRGKNNVLRFRVGGDLGSHNRAFGLGIEGGFEFIQTLNNGLQLVVQQKNEITFWAKPRFKNGLLVGVKFPF